MLASVVTEILVVVFAEEGKPDVYTYQWYVNGNAVAGATAASFTRTAPAIGTENIYCVVTNKAGTVQSKTAILNVAREDINIDANFVDGGSWGGYISGGVGSVVYENGTYKVDIDYIAQIGEKKFEALTAALEAADPADVYKQYLDMGATMIQTDRPELLLDYLRSVGRHD